MILTFTGTRRGMTPQQLLAALSLINTDVPTRFLHGGAPGADTEIDASVAALYWQRSTGQERLVNSIFGGAPVGVYPADATRQSFWLRDATHGAVREVYEPMAPLKRDRIMARLCDRLIACPAEQVGERLRSGTWATVRYAREFGKPVTVVRPDGTVESLRAAAEHLRPVHAGRVRGGASPSDHAA